MGRSGFYEMDGEDPLAEGRSLAHQRSAMYGKRGQRLLRDLIAALDAMPEKRLVSDVLVEKDSGEVCALGCLGKARGLPIETLDPEKHDELAKAFDVSETLIQLVEWTNDEYAKTPEDRWRQVRAWAESELLPPASLEPVPGAPGRA